MAYGPGRMQLIDVAGRPFGTSLNPVSVSLIDSNVANVAYYGAKGDGVTDDTAAIKLAIAAIPATGGILLFPPGAAGNYKISDSLPIKPYTTITGAGDSAVTITQSVNNKDIFSSVDPFNIIINNLKLVGTGAGTGIGIDFTLSVNTNMMLISIERVTVSGFGSDGIHLENPIVSVLNRVQAVNNGGYGFNLVGVGAGVIGTSTSLISCYANANTGAAGYRFFKMCYCSVTGCAADSNAIGYLMDSCQGFSLSGCGAESNTTNGYKITGGFGVSITSSWVYDNRSVGFYVTGTAAAVVLTAIIDNSPHAGAVNFLKVDAGSAVTLNTFSNVTANSLAAGTTFIVNDGAGNMTITGSLHLTGNALNFAGDAIADLYRVSAGQLATDGGLTINGVLHLAGNSMDFAGDGTADLYRLSAGTLTTDGSFTVGTNLKVLGNVGFYNTAPVAKQTVTGSKGANAALTSLMTALAALGLVTNSTT